MNVLVVNGFPNSAKSKRRFETFLSLIKKTFQKLCRRSGIDHIEYIVRNYNDIDDFLSDLNSNRNVGFNNDKLIIPNGNKIEPINFFNKRFEKLDFIFIDGCENFLPWKKLDKNSNKFVTLLKMCKLTNKVLFAGGVGMQILMYFFATNFNTELNIINQDGEIENIENIDKIPQIFLDDMKKNEYFLDYVSGDIYEFKHETREWLPYLNIGLHKSKSAEDYSYRGKYVINKNPYRPKSIETTSTNLGNFTKEECMAINTEVKVILQKKSLYHWLIKDLNLDFVVESTSNWFSHNFCVKYKDLQYNILADCNKGPVLIEHGNSVGVSFHISPKYPTTVSILENFIIKKFNEVQDKGFGRVEVNDSSKYNNNNSNGADSTNVKNINNHNESSNPSLQSKNLGSIVINSQLYSNLKTIRRENINVGLRISNRDMIFVENNSVNNRPVSSAKGDNFLNRPGTAYNTRKSFAFYTNGFDIRKSTVSGILEPHTAICHINTNNKNETDSYQGLKSQIIVNTNTNTIISQSSLNSHDNESKIKENKERVSTKSKLKKKKEEEDNIIEYYKKMRSQLTNDLVEYAKVYDSKSHKLAQALLTTDLQKQIKFMSRISTARTQKSTYDNLKREKYDSDNSLSQEDDNRNYFRNSTNGFNVNVNSFKESPSNITRYKSGKTLNFVDGSNDSNKTSKNNLRPTTSSTARDIHDKQENVFAILFPYVRQEEFPKPIERHVNLYNKINRF